jgi:hypothetical protein
MTDPTYLIYPRQPAQVPSFSTAPALNKKSEAALQTARQTPTIDNYRGELLGALGPLLLLTAAFKARPDLDQEELLGLTQKMHCDNRGMVLHGNQPNTALKDGQKQADLICLLKSYTRKLPCKVEWVHIHAHADDHTRWEDLTHLQQLNFRCNKRAKKGLHHAILSINFMFPVFPDKDIAIAVNNVKACSSIKSCIYKN